MTPEPLLVGLPVSVSGRFSRQGRQVLAGVNRWVRRVNARGGLRLGSGHRPLELVRYDDESRSAVAARLTRRLIRDDEVDLLFGPYSSGLTRATTPIADAHDMVLWNHSGATDALYEEESRWLVSVLTPASRYFHGVLDALERSGRSVSRAAVCWSRSGSFGDAVASGATAHAHDLGVTVGERTWEPPLDDAASIVDSLRADDPGLVLVAGSFEDDVRLVSELVGRDAPEVIGSVAAGISAFGEQLGDAAHGVFGPSQWEPALDHAPDYGPSPADVVALFESTPVQATDYPAVQAFATGIVIERCLAEGYDATTETIDQRQLRNTAGTADFTTFYGRFRIDAAGKQVGHAPVTVQWQSGEKRVVWPESHRRVEPLWSCQP